MTPPARRGAASRSGRGDALLLYTDGLVERRTEVIDVGIDRLAARFGEGSAVAAEACERIVSDLADNLADDAAILAVTRMPMAGERLHTVVPAHPNRLADLRRRLAAWLPAHGASREEANDIVLATHEAAMNAIEHAYGPATRRSWYRRAPATAPSRSPCTTPAAGANRAASTEGAVAR